MIKAGDKGPQVQLLQEKLLCIGYVLPGSMTKEGKVDGAFGPDTATACMRYAIERRLVPVPEMGTGNLKPSKLRESIESMVIPDSLINHILAATHRYRGLDCSQANGLLDWGKVFASGKKYCWHRCSMGKTGKDKAFDQNWEAMGQTGMLRGAYHLFNPNRGPEQLDNYRLAVELGPGDLRPMIDVEGNEPEPSANKNLGLTIEAFTKAYGVPPVIYSSARMYDLWDLTVGGECPGWFTVYSVGADTPRLPPPFHTWTIAQKGYGGGKGKFARVPGSNGDLDDNLANGGAEVIEALRLT